jgi:hypothetical protein
MYRSDTAESNQIGYTSSLMGRLQRANPGVSSGCADRLGVGVSPRLIRGHVGQPWFTEEQLPVCDTRAQAPPGFLARPRCAAIFVSAGRRPDGSEPCAPSSGPPPGPGPPQRPAQRDGRQPGRPQHPRHQRDSSRPGAVGSLGTVALRHRAGGPLRHPGKHQRLPAVAADPGQHRRVHA